MRRRRGGVGSVVVRHRHQPTHAAARGVPAASEPASGARRGGGFPLSVPIMLVHPHPQSWRLYVINKGYYLFNETKEAPKASVPAGKRK